MCGRYELNTEKDNNEINNIIAEINTLYPEANYKTGEIFPTNSVPILTGSEDKVLPVIMNWGFPKWDGKGVIINAKSETAKDKKMFSKPLAEKRCVIPSTGFFEWQKKEISKTKDKFMFINEDSKVLYMAGIYNSFKNEDKITEFFVIFTRAANSFIRDIHDRMPVILYENEIKDWLTDDKCVELIFQRESVRLGII